ncbi:regulator of chromosome condensation (RCC1) family protein [Galdieria sulphuraria]|uniref:Regulator of chromosome condensation (RCC1) family protein n=1 Tax=Galdieria sulphuraria TaxID=130081 RepID=M2WYR1_GALSU|nr:regulator of chromosome condensation (RCC1) family protein [Galdieria sulphuraria]EME29195.1 regulator of chromosome condensation (RCC1) family protein [Galdieria sulphuraria]|eukprot:XP_005705715.1 regulator of chromosome condensation (RCC1) family protein [Galdieria sulphuraria]
MSCTNYGENRAFLWRCGRNLFQDDTPAYGNKSSVDENNVVWTCLTFPENFHFPLRALETTWSSIFLVDNQGHLFYRGPYFLQDWTDYPSSIQNQSQHSSSWLPLVNPDICDIQSLSASSNLLVLIADGGAKLVVFPSSNIGSSSPSLQHWSSWSSDSTICYYQSVATGRDHFLVIVDEGDVYGWGTNDYGQLGIGWEIQSDQSVHIQCKYSHQLTRIEAIPSKMAQKVACCDMSSAVLLKNGRVIVFGNNLYLQLGTHLCCPIQLPQRLDTFSEDHPALDIALSGWQLAVLGCQGEIWISGKEPIHPLQEEDISYYKLLMVYMVMVVD